MESSRIWPRAALEGNARVSVRSSVWWCNRWPGGMEARSSTFAKSRIWRTGLFESLQPLHKLPPENGRLLEAAAYLHDIGHFVSDTSHHKHSAYLVANSDLPGFTAQERKLIAQLCRYHRRSMPKARHDQFQALSSADQRIVTLLSPLLRLASSLDRSHQQRIESLDCHLRNGNVILYLKSAADTDLDQWARGAGRRNLSTDIREAAGTRQNAGIAGRLRMALPQSFDIQRYAKDQIATRLGKLAFEVRKASQAMDADSVHDLRVAVRRFNQSLIVFESLLPKREVKKARSRMKRLMDTAGEIRDRDIAGELMDDAGIAADDSLRLRIVADRKQAQRDLEDRIRRWNRKDFSAKWRTGLQLDRR